MENIVGCTFFVLLLIGIGVLISAKKGSQPNRRITAGFAILGAAFLLFGVASLALIRQSPRPEVSGYITSVRSGGRNHSSSQFTVQSDDGRTVPVHAKYTGPGLIEGEKVRVRFVQYNRDLLELTALSGPYTGWQLRESDGSTSTIFLGSIGFLLIVAAIFQNRKLPAASAATRNGNA